MSTPSLSFENSTTRAYDGAIVTFVNKVNDDLRVEHRAGYKYESWSGRVKGEGGTRVTNLVGFLDVIRLLMAEADGWEGDWKVVTICTPISIYADLTSKRPTSKTGIVSYEAAVLTRAGRIDMWDGTYAHERHERERRAQELRHDPRRGGEGAPDRLQGNTSAEVGEGS